MIKISQENNGYKMVFSNPGSGTRGFKVVAKNIAEVNAAVQHYYGSGKCVDICPLCKDRKPNA
jgi:hypothetical protein